MVHTTKYLILQCTFFFVLQDVSYSFFIYIYLYIYIKFAISKVTGYKKKEKLNKTKYMWLNKTQPLGCMCEILPRCPLCRMQIWQYFQHNQGIWSSRELLSRSLIVLAPWLHPKEQNNILNFVNLNTSRYLHSHFFSSSVKITTIETCCILYT